MFFYKHSEEPVKTIKDRVIQGLGVRFGSPETADYENDWFSKDTEFGVRNGDVRPLWMEHGRSEKFGSKIVGYATYEFTESGLAYEAKMVDGEIGEKAYGEIKSHRYMSSSASAWHTTRSSVIKDTNHYDMWFIVEQSLTNHPADYYNPPVSVKSLMGVHNQTDLIIKLYEQLANIKQNELKIFQQLVEKFSTTEDIKVELPDSLLKEIEDCCQQIGTI